MSKASKLVERSPQRAIRASDGISRQQLTNSVRSGELERLTRGVYVPSDELDDEMYRIQCRRRDAIFSHDTALYLHGLSDRVPLRFTLCVPSGANTSHLKDENVKVYYIKPELHELGLSDGKSHQGRALRVYSPERAICDALRNRRDMDWDIVLFAIRQYMGRRGRNIGHLMECARALRVVNRLRTYLEVL